MAAKNKAILITGADGYIGSRIATDLLQRGHDNLVLYGRRPHDSNNPSIRYALGDLANDEPFNGIAPSEIGTIIHSAAITRFNVERPLAQQVNVEGTAKLIEFAEKCSSLDRFLFVSSVYASGLQPGELVEEPFTGEHGFANNYEESKWQCEQQVIASTLPWQIARVATVVSDSVTGEVSQFNAVHNTLKLFYYGMLSLIPGVKDACLYFTTGEFVTTALRAILSNGKCEGIYHVSSEYSNSIQLNAFVDSSYETFQQDQSFKRRRVLPPLYSDIDSFLALSDTMIHFGQGIMSQASASVSPFAKQLFVKKQVHADELKAIMPDYEAVDMAALVPRMCEWLVENKWGRAHAAV